MRGRKPKPMAQRRLEGNPGKRALPRDVPEPPAAAPEAPEHLNAVARAEWDRIVVELVAIGSLALCDRSALAAYCANYARWVRAEEMIARLSSELVTTPNGAVQINPWVSIANRAMELMHKFGTEFGLTPASRVRLGQQRGSEGVLPNYGSPPADDLDRFLAQRPPARLH